MFVYIRVSKVALVVKKKKKKNPTCQGRRHKRCSFDPWVGKIPCRRVQGRENLPGWRLEEEFLVSAPARRGWWGDGRGQKGKK